MTKNEKLIKILTIDNVFRVFPSPSAYKRRLARINKALESVKISSLKYRDSAGEGVVSKALINILDNISVHVYADFSPDKAYAEAVTKYAPKLYLYTVHRRWHSNQFRGNNLGLLQFYYRDILKAVASQPTPLDIAYIEVIWRQTHKTFIKRIEKKIKEHILKHPEDVVE